MQKGYTMSDLRKYRATINGTEATVMLNEADAKALGAVPVDGPAPEPAATPGAEVKADQPQNKARTAENKGR